MKFIKHKSSALIVVIFLALGFGIFSCSSDNEIVPKELEQYKSELSEIVSSEKVIVSNCVMGYDMGNFRVDTLLYLEATTDYMNALNSADSILALDGLTIADIMEGNDMISSPGAVFNANIWISDRRPLQEVIVYCDTLRVHTPEGIEPGMAPQEARDQFSAAITTAKSVRGSSITIERQVTAATEVLNIELKIFEEAIIK
ncbi:MAG: hypothetical protein ACERKD_14480 [Prolixibacteraceae bacterium]